MAHRVIWLMVHGEFPDHIDHIDGDRTNNRIINLRNVSKKENAKNRAVSSLSITGVSGVRFDKSCNKFRVTINTSSGRKRIGSFADFDSAVEARKAAEASNGYHVNHGRIAA